MARIYSTEELLRILEQERRACISGQRLNLAASPTGISPTLDLLVKPDGIQKFTAYNDFRATIHAYQRSHQVSGIVWQTVTVGDRVLRYPKLDEQLISLPEDLAVLQAAQPAILAFWWDVTQAMELYLSMNGGKFYQLVTIADVDRIAQRAEWTSLWRHGKEQQQEIILQLGWGKPEAAVYRRGFPESGSEFVHAVNIGNRPIG
jgi:hypothetical protein